MKLGEYTLEVGPPVFRSCFPPGQIEQTLGWLREWGIDGDIEMFLSYDGRVYFLEPLYLTGQTVLACSLPDD